MPDTRRGFRLVRSTTVTEDDFLPQAYQPDPQVPGSYKKNSLLPNPATSDWYDLSFYKDLRGAVRLHAKLRSDNRVNVAEFCGDFLAVVDLLPTHGLMRKKPSRNGHFALHPAVDVTFVPHVADVAAIEDLQEAIDA